MTSRTEPIASDQVGSRVLRVAVIGAGLAGLMAARALTALGHRVTVFEKSRAPGGRAATRRHDDLAFDHGAQYFTHRDPRLAAHMAAWERDRVIAPWAVRTVARRGAETMPVSETTRRWVAVPGMRALGVHLAREIDVRYATTVRALERDGAVWRVRQDATEADTPFDAVLVTVPAPQAHALLAAHAPSFLSAVASAHMRPCLALMLELDTRPAVSWEAAFVNEHPVLSWVARNSSKPGRSAHECWVAHASAAWSDGQLLADPSSLVSVLVEAFAEIVQTPIEVRHATVHRWRYAIPEADAALAHGEAAYDATLGLGVGGDWCVGGRVEGALVSGLALAERVHTDAHTPG